MCVGVVSVFKMKCFNSLRVRNQVLISFSVISTAVPPDGRGMWFCLIIGYAFIFVSEPEIFRPVSKQCCKEFI